MAFASSFLCSGVFDKCSIRESKKTSDSLAHNKAMNATTDAAIATDKNIHLNEEVTSSFKNNLRNNQTNTNPNSATPFVILNAVFLHLSGAISYK